MPQPKFKTYKSNARSKVKQFTSWSFTRYSDWKRCPLFAKLKHLDKVSEGPKNPAMLRGAEVAQKSEDYLLKRTNRLAKELSTFKDHYKFFRAQKSLVAEESWGFTADWQPTAWDDWNNCKLRVKVDVGYLFLEDNSFNVRDGKTGKFRPEKNEEYMLQLELYVAAGAAKYPTVDMLTAGLMYTDEGIEYPQDEPLTYTMADALKLQKTWDRRIKPMFADRTFAPRPGNYCRWCPYSASKAGPCKF